MCVPRWERLGHQFTRVNEEINRILLETAVPSSPLPCTPVTPFFIPLPLLLLSFSGPFHFPIFYPVLFSSPFLPCPLPPLSPISSLPPLSPISPLPPLPLPLPFPTSQMRVMTTLITPRTEVTCNFQILTLPDDTCTDGHCLRWGLLAWLG